MTNSRIGLLTSFAVVLSLSTIPTDVGMAAPPRCDHPLAHYTEYARWLQPLAERARQQADDNPIYDSDVQYYAAELGDTLQCIRNLTPVALPE